MQLLPEKIYIKVGGKEHINKTDIKEFFLYSTTARRRKKLSQNE